MTPSARLIALLLLLSVAGPAGAAGPPLAARCAAPKDLLVSDVRLDRVAQALAAGQALNILVLGTATSAGAGASAAARAYPARMEAALAADLGTAHIALTVVAEPGRSAVYQAAGLPALLARHRPHLVVWQTGTVDAMRGLDLGEFAQALQSGAIETEVARADLLLIQPQYGSRAESLRDISPYLEAMEQMALAHDVLLFRRHAIMKHWVEAGQFDFAATGRLEQVQQADGAHDCIGQLLARAIRSAVR